MKRRYLFPGLISTAIMLSGTISNSAHADDSHNMGPSWYIGTSGDITWLQNYNTGGGGNVALGYQFPSGDFGDFRIEAEGGYHDMSEAHYYT